MLGVFVASSCLLTAPRAPSSRHPPIRCALAEERANSGKAAVFSAVAGSVAALPAALVGGAVGGFTPQWELSHDVLALQLALFGVVYRYAAREDESEMLKQGVVGAFAVTRASAGTQASASCTALPLSCGAPIGYASWEMIAQGAGVGAESLLAFGGSALALEYACSRGWLSKLAGELPSEEDDAADAPALSDAELAEKERKREALSAKRSWDMKMRWREKKAAENPDE